MTTPTMDRPVTVSVRGTLARRLRLQARALDLPPGRLGLKAIRLGLLAAAEAEVEQEARERALRRNAAVQP